MSALTADDCRFILTSLEFTEMKFQDYPYPGPEIRREQLAAVRAVILKVRALRDEMKIQERSQKGVVA